MKECGEDKELDKGLESAGPGVLSKGLFLWVQHLLRSGYFHALRETDVLPMPRRLHPEVLRKRFKENWKMEIERAQGSDGRREPRLGRVLWQILHKDCLLAAMFQISVAGVKFGCIVLLRRLTEIILIGEDADRTEGIVVAMIFLVLSFCENAGHCLAAFSIQQACYGLVGIFATATLEKGFSMSPEAWQKYGRGDMVTLALSDCTRLIEISGVAMQGVMGPILLLIYLGYLCVLLGPMVIAALLVVAAATFGLLKVGKMQGAAFAKKSATQGKRLSCLNEMLQSVRFVKYYGLEEQYHQQMKQIRGSEEEVAIRRLKISQALSWPVAASIPPGMAMLVMCLHLLIHGHLPSIPDTFVVVAAARNLYFPFAFFGGFMGCVMMLKAALTRLRALLFQSDMQRMVLKDAMGECAVLVDGCNFSWSTTGSPTLSNVQFAMPCGDLWVVVGEIGSGKSSLLSAVLGNLYSTAQGSEPAVAVHATSCVYVAQEAMVMNASLKDNIIFGCNPQSFHKDSGVRYEEAIDAAALRPDLEVLPAGDETEIGEKGITLSGGQKARVALARAVFASHTNGLVLLDDPLAAVDAHVGAHLFEKCICEALKSTTRLLVTNQLQFLSHPSIARVLVMRDGQIVEEGCFTELVRKSDGCLVRMLESTGVEQQYGGMDKGAWLKGEAYVAVTKHKAVSKTLDDALVKDGKDQHGERPSTFESRITQDEKKQEGVVKLSTFMFYFRSMGGVPVACLLAMLSWGWHLSEIVPDILLVSWQEDMLDLSEEAYLACWLTACTFAPCLTFFARMMWVRATTRAGSTVHYHMLSHLMHCTMRFFDQTPSGRIMNRLGEDQTVMDLQCAGSLEIFFLIFWTVTDIILIAVITRPWLGPIVLLLGILFHCLREVHRRVSREAVRWWSLSKSPMFHIMEEALSGVPTICAFHRQDFFLHRFEKAVAQNCAWKRVVDATAHWANQRLGLLGAILVCSLALLLVLQPGEVRPSFGAVAILYALTLGEQLKHLVHFTVMVESNFASVERCQEFTGELEQEPPAHCAGDHELRRDDWPGTECELVFENVSVRYLPHLPRALDSLTIHLRAREKVGIVGRTGSGKSTIMGALFRLFPLDDGKIFLGGVDTAKIGISLLRKCITIVPQDPILFSGHLRRNLDPLNALSDGQIWDSLKKCGLMELVQGSDRSGLDELVAEGGTNFSLGERQVLCLARAILRGTRVLCLDEATASVDPTNDERIQHVLKEEVTEMLVLTIAHRLHTVNGCNRILVLDKGRAAQLDTPSALLEQPGIFRDLATKAGIVKTGVVQI